MELSKQEYQSGLSFPSPGDLPDPEIKPRSPALQADSLLSEPPRKPSRKSVRANVISPRSQVWALTTLWWPMTKQKLLPVLGTWHTVVFSNHLNKRASPRQITRRRRHLQASYRAWKCRFGEFLVFLLKGLATYSSLLAQRIPWTEEPGRLHTVQGVTESQT